jgi:hypothetical protein
VKSHLFAYVCLNLNHLTISTHMWKIPLRAMEDWSQLGSVTDQPNPPLFAAPSPWEPRDSRWSWLGRLPSGYD